MEFIKAQKIKFRHVDPAGIVFYPRWMEMLNELVEDWFDEALHYSFAKMHQDHGVPTVEMNVQFRKPAKLGEEVKMHLWVNKLGNSSLVYGFKFVHQDGDVCFEGQVSLVFVQLITGGIKPTPWIPALRASIEKYLKQ